jgi:hypothetical protein
MRVEALSRSEWMASLDRLTGYAPFVSPRFMDSWALEHETATQPRPWRITDRSGAWRLVVLVELSTSRFGTRSLIAPEGGYTVAGEGRMPGQWPQSLLRCVRTIATDNVELIIPPQDEFDASGVSELVIRQEHAWIIDLSAGAEAWLRGTLDRRTRRQLALAEAHGVVTRRCGIEGLDDFEMLYRRELALNSARRAYPARFLRALLDNGLAALYLSSHGGRPIAAGFLLQAGNQALAWIGCFDRAYAHLHANLHRHCAVIHDLCAAGVNAYNLGAAPGLPAVANFKRKLGALPHPYATVAWRNPWLGRLRRMLGRGLQ